MAFSPDGKHLATAGFDPAVKVLDAATGEERLTLRVARRDKGGIGFCVVFSPDGKRLATADDLRRRPDLGRRHRGRAADGPVGHSAASIHRLAFSPDGKRLATSAGRQGGESSGTRPAAGRSSRSRATPTRSSRSTFSPDGRTLASCGYDDTVRTWDAATGAAVRTLTGHTGDVYDVAFSPDGKTLASVSTDGTVRVWEAAALRGRGD